MKILFDHNEPFLLAHGGFQILIERTAEALRNNGVEVEYLRWWDASQSGDVIHFFGRASAGQIDFAQRRGIKYVMHELLTSQGSRSRRLLQIQGLVNRILRRSLPPSFRIPLRWDSYRMADAILASTDWEAWIMRTLFDAPLDRLHVVPTGVDDVFFKSSPLASRPVSSEARLLCLATITERKRIVELVQAAIEAAVPLTIIGKPYSDGDPYYLRFLETVSASGGIINYAGGVSDPEFLAPMLQAARGFVLLSTMETQSTAALAAAAAGCPLLLADLPWARCTFGDTASYVPVGTPSLPQLLRSFHENAHLLVPPKLPSTWGEVAGRLLRIYKSLPNRTSPTPNKNLLPQ